VWRHVQWGFVCNIFGITSLEFGVGESGVWTHQITQMPYPHLDCCLGVMDLGLGLHKLGVHNSGV
jgi:hypothetical protein